MKEERRQLNISGRDFSGKPGTLNRTNGEGQTNPNKL